MKAAKERYDKIGIGYANQRHSDPRIYRQIRQALTQSDSILNVGAGTGSYEPADVPTVAVEPSTEMIRQRRNKANVVRALSEALPFGAAAFHSVLAVLTIHHWPDLDNGLQECARACKHQITILTWDPEFPGFWLTKDYFPEILVLDRGIFPSMDKLRRILGPVRVEVVPVPADCVDGFTGAYWQRPEAYLDETIRSGMSSFARVATSSEGLARLRKDLSSGDWQKKYGNLLAKESLDLGYRLITARLC